MDTYILLDVLLCIFNYRVLSDYGYESYLLSHFLISYEMTVLAYNDLKSLEEQEANI